VAAAGEYAVRSRGASGFGFSAIVGSGRRSNAVVPRRARSGSRTASLSWWHRAQGQRVRGRRRRRSACDRRLHIPPARLPEVSQGGFLPDSGAAPAGEVRQRDRCARQGLFRSARPFEISRLSLRAHDRLARKQNRPSSASQRRCPQTRDDRMRRCQLLRPPEFNGARIETGYEITENGTVPFSKKMDRPLSRHHPLIITLIAPLSLDSATRKASTPCSIGKRCVIRSPRRTRPDSSSASPWVNSG